MLDILGVCVVQSSGCIGLIMCQHADRAQQTFSSENEPSLHVAIPALEALHNAWSKRIVKDKYTAFVEPIQAGIDKLSEYYDRTGDSSAYVLSMSKFYLTL